MSIYNPKVKKKKNKIINSANLGSFCLFYSQFHNIAHTHTTYNTPAEPNCRRHATDF